MGIVDKNIKISKLNHKIMMRGFEWHRSNFVRINNL